MTPRNTSTGAVLEAMVLPALDRGGYVWRVQVETETRPGGRRHQVDAIAAKDGDDVLVSMKWQQTSETAEQKVELIRFGGHKAIVFGNLRMVFECGLLVARPLVAGAIQAFMSRGTEPYFFLETFLSSFA